MTPSLRHTVLFAALGLGALVLAGCGDPCRDIEDKMAKAKAELVRDPTKALEIAKEIQELTAQSIENKCR